MKAQIKYVCLNHEGQPVIDTASYSSKSSKENAVHLYCFMPGTWEELKKNGWTCKKLVISFQEVEL